MESKKINQLATEMSPAATDLTIVGDPITGVSKKITLEQIASLFAGSVSFYANLAAFPVTGTIDTIYCAKDTNKLYLWSGSAYVQTFPSQALLDTYQLRSEKGNANGYASLGGDGKVPSNQLPSYVDDVVEVANFAALPVTGETGKIYITLDNNKVYRWTGSIYVEIAANTAVWGAITGTLSNQTDLQNALNTKLSSVGLTMPTAFTVTNSPLTGAGGTLAVTGAGDATQYINGAGNLTTFPTLLSSDNLVKLVRNQSGATMTAGTVIYISGATGNKPLIAKALATGDATSAQTYGLLQTDIANNADGYVVVIGNVTNIDTSALTEGQQLYLSGTTAGTYTTTKPYAPIHLVYVGIVLRAHPTMGIIGVKIQNGYEMDELHNVAAQSPSNGDILQYVTSTSLWTKTAGTTTNIAEGTNLYYTDVRARAALSFVAGSGAYNSTTGVITIPTNNTQITNGANYITLTSLSAGVGISYNNTTGVITNSAPDQTVSLTAGAGISVSGTYPSFTIASTITQYTDALARAAISLTTTGTSGAATYNSTTGVFNIPNYTTDLSGYLPLTGGTLTGPLGGTSASFSSTGRFIGALTIGTDFAQLLPISSSNYQLLVGSYYDGTNIIATATSGSRTVYNIGGMDFRTFTGATVGSSVTDISRFTIVSTGAAAFTGSVTAQGGLIFDTSQVISSSGVIGFNSTQGLFIYTKTGSSYDFKIYNGVGSTFMQVPTGTQNVEFLGAATFSSSVTALDIYAKQSTGGYISLRNGGAGASGYVEFISNNGTTRLGYIGYSTTNIGYIAEGSAIHAFTGAATFSSSVTAAGVLTINATSNSDWAGAINNLGTTGANGLYVNIGASSTGTPFAVYKNFSQLFKVANDGAATFSSSVTATSYNRAAAGTGFLNGKYGSAEGISTTGPIYCIGDSYVPTSTSLNTMYGIGYSYNQFTGKFGPTDTWGMYVSANGSAGVFLAGSGQGYFAAAVTATGFFESSDKRIKTLIEDNYQTKGIELITPKLYTKNGKVELGYYAQDFVGILDSAISKIDDGMLNLSYREVHTAKIYALEQRIKELESKLN